MAPFFFNSETLDNDIVDWGPARAIYLAPPADSGGVTLNQITLDYAGDISYAQLFQPVLSVAIKVFAGALDTTDLLGPETVWPLHSDTMTATTEVWTGPSISHFGAFSIVWVTNGLDFTQRIMDYSHLGGIKIEPGHHAVVNLYPAISSPGDGQGNLWLFDVFRATFYLSEQ